jgi:hypothetical protein
VDRGRILVADVLHPTDQEISEDTPCVHCGYNLRGLTRDKFCPECGTPIARSIFGNQLRYADPAWLEKLRFGTSLKLWNIVIGLLIGAGAAIVMAAGLPAVWTFLLTLVGGALGLWATFLITTQEPRVALGEDPITLRKAVRFCAVFAFSGQLVNQAAELGGERSLVFVIAGSALSLLGVVQAFGELVYYRRFARRIPDAKLERSTSIVLWGLPAATALLALGAIVTVLSAAAAASGGLVLAASMPIICVGGVALLVFGLWYIRLLLGYRKAFKEAIPIARQCVHQGGFGSPPGSATPLG